MRQMDAPDVGELHKKQRLSKTIYGFLISIGGGVLMFYLPTETEMVRLVIGGLLILLGGMMVSKQTVTEWWGLFGGLVPWGKKTPK